MSNIQVYLDPEKRIQYLENLCKMDGLFPLKENPKASYCPISLTLTPDDLKPFIAERQKILMTEILEPTGIIAYDPGTAPYSPDTNLKSQPNEIYTVDIGKIVSSRFFVGHDILPSTGFGIEMEIAKVYNRISVVLIDKNIRVSRMQPHRTIYLQYENCKDTIEDLREVFTLLQEFEPGIGFNNNIPALLGFEKKRKKNC